MNPIIVKFVKTKIWEITCDELGVSAKLKADNYDEAVEKFQKFIEDATSRGLVCQNIST